MTAVTTSFNRTEATAELISAIATIKRSLHGHIYHCADGSELTSGELGLLFVVKKDGPISAQDIAARLAMTPGAVSQIVDKLLDGGYVVRTPRETDRRVLNLTLSERGLRQVADIEHAHHMLIKQMTEAIDDTELAQLIVTLNKMIQTSQKMNETKRKEPTLQ